MNEETLFDLIVNASESERDVLLDEHCGGNPQLRSRMENLLKAHFAGESAAIDPTELHDVLAEDSKLVATQDPAATNENDVGTVLGEKYTLREQIGEGGMGAVWLATQSTPVKRKVAVKLIKAGMDSRQVVARFEAERQALAMMDHPNIAKVFDGGITEQGRPYFVMEYVKGIPLTDYCDQTRLSVKQRLELFMPICQAIQHAHQKGIVHRDLKPSNILVCLYDGKPVCKVIDFGLAKAMHQPLTEQSVYTHHGVMVGTPLYMSPEQAEYNNLDVDTRTDIYSLGVVLYELLTGTTPLEREQLHAAAYDEVLRLIKEVEPPRPSMRLSQSDSLPSIAAQRSIEPRHLGRSLSGDLDWIVMKSLEKERSRRYETASGLARDVERYLNEEAIEARPPSSTYRLGKFLKKHKLQATAFSAVLLAMVIGTSAVGWGWFKAIESEQKVRKSLVKVAAERDAKNAALARVSAERDAKNDALAAEAKQRAVAEQVLIEGILRPIGFGSEAEEDALLDWAQLPSDRLRLRILEVALDSPSTAIRLVETRQGVLHACVGMSLDRQRRALELLAAAKSRQPMDHSIGLCTTMLTMELGELNFEVARDAISLVFGSRTKRVHARLLAELLVSQRGKLTDDQSRRLFEKILDGFENSETNPIHIDRDNESLYELVLDAFDCDSISPKIRNRFLEFVAQNVAEIPQLLPLAKYGFEPDSQWERLSPAQRNHARNALQVILLQRDRWFDFYRFSRMFGELAAYADDKQLQGVWELIVELMEFDALLWSLEELRPIATRATQDQLVCLLRPLLDPTTVSLVEQANWYGTEGMLEYSNVIGLLISCLGRGERKAFLAQLDALPNHDVEITVRKLCLHAALFQHDMGGNKSELLDQMLKFEQAAYQHHAFLLFWLQCLGNSISEADDDQVEYAWKMLNTEEFIETITVVLSEYEFAYGDIPVTVLQPLQVIVTQMTEHQFKQALQIWEASLKDMSRTVSDRQLAVLSLYAFIDRLTDEQLRKNWDANVELLLRDVCSWPELGLPLLELVVERLTQDQLELICQRFRTRLTDPEFVDDRRTTVDAMARVSKKLSSSQLDGFAHQVISILEVEDRRNAELLVRTSLEFLIPVIDRLHDMRIEQLLNRDLVLSPEDISLDVALASRSPVEQHEPRIRLMMEQVIETGGSCGRLPEVVYDAKQIARWLRNRKCVGLLRERLLTRFEELVLHHGKPVFRVTEESEFDGQNPSDSNTPTRQFLTIYDAAKWIEKNWPEFDLEYPATEETAIGQRW